MADYKRDRDELRCKNSRVARLSGTTIYDIQSNTRMGEIRGMLIYDARGNKIAELKGGYIYDGRGSKIGEPKDVTKCIEGTTGSISDVAFWVLIAR